MTTRRLVVLLSLGALAATGCDLASTSVEDPADVRGTWAFTGDQAVPPRDLVGTLTISDQQGDLISGTMSWEERDGGGGITLDGGAVTGRVLGPEDVDFDVIRAAGSRRFLARITADTLVGTWVELVGGRSGDFRAEREQP